MKGKRARSIVMCGAMLGLFPAAPSKTSAQSGVVPPAVPRAVNHVDTPVGLGESPSARLLHSTPTGAGGIPLIERLPPVPSDDSPWWHQDIRGSLIERYEPLPVDVESLLLAAMTHSVRIRTFAQEPLIEETRIDEAKAAFDWVAYLESRWDKLSNPTDNSLIPGPGRSRYRTQSALAEGGIRRQNSFGGELNLSQRFAFDQSNSQFFAPGDQALGQLRMSYTQPLLRGAGQSYNRSQVVVAAIHADAAQDRFLERLQQHLLEVTESYWGLYRARGLYRQQLELMRSAQSMVEQMEARALQDGAAGPLAQAKAAVARRWADLQSLQTEVLDAQDRLRSLVNADWLDSQPQVELLPLDAPSMEPVHLDMQSSLATAFDHRPEIQAALREIKAASVENDVATADLLPQLDLVLETYASGLRGGYDAGGAWIDQFSVGEPSYAVSLNYQMPLGNRAATARDRRKRLEVARLQSHFQNVVEQVALDVRSAVRAVDTYERELRVRREAVNHATEEMQYIRNRLRLVPAANDAASLYLDNLLASQERVARQEGEYLQAMVDYSLSLVRLKQVTGTLLQLEYTDEPTDTNPGSTEPLPDGQESPSLTRGPATAEQPRQAARPSFPPTSVWD